MKGRGVFVTGTDTGVGKTWVATRLLACLRDRGVHAVGMKPIECGGREDSQALLAASSEGEFSLDAINPITISEPVAPAAAKDSAEIDSNALKAHYEALQAKSDFVVVEGAGGWIVPLDEKSTMEDLAVELGLPVLIVAANRLGVLNHTLLTARAIQSAGLSCIAVFLNRIGDTEDASQSTNREMLEKSLDGIPVIEDNLEVLADLIFKP